MVSFNLDFLAANYGLVGLYYPPLPLTYPHKLCTSNPP